MNTDKYHADLLNGTDTPPSLNASIAKILVTETPRRAWLEHPRLNPNYAQDESGKFDMGKAAHNFLLEGGDKLVVVRPEENRNKPTKEHPDGKIPEGWTNDAMRSAAAMARENGCIPMLPEEYEQVRLMGEMAKDTMRKNGISFADMLCEHPIAFQIDGTHCRARLDMLSNDYTMRLDYKTTSAKTPEEWIRRYLSPMGHDIQDDFHSRAVEAEYGVMPRSLFLVQQDFGDYDCFLVELSPAFKEMARVKVERALKIWNVCLEENYWPGFQSGVIVAEPTSWQLADAEEMDAVTKGFSKEAFLFGRVKK